MLNVWAFGPGIMNARGRVSNPSAVACAGHGASGSWDRSLTFENLPDLAFQLSTLREVSASNEAPHPVPSGSIRRLAINVHGSPGVSQVDRNPEKMLRSSTVLRFDSELQRIGAALHSRAWVYLMSCNTGQGQAGSDLLMYLSDCWRGRSVVGFSTIVVGESQLSAPGTTRCRFPDVFETDFIDPTNAMSVVASIESSGYRAAATLPLASDSSPHAKVALNGRIVRYPSEERRPARRNGRAHA